ncbi:tetratricopeptide repeat protein [Aquimarina rhabdastrellae]
MKLNYILILFISITYLSWSQKQEDNYEQFKNQIANEVCDCLIYELKDFKFNSLKACFSKSMDLHVNKFNSIIENDNTIQNELEKKKFKVSLLYNVQEQLIIDSYLYYETYKNLRNEQFEKYGKKVSLEDVNIFNKRIAEKKDDYLIFQRGNIYYFNKKYEEAEQDYKTSLDMNQDNATYQLQLANLYEKLERYTEAEELYQKVLKHSKKQKEVVRAKIFKAIVSQKVKEKEWLNTLQFKNDTSQSDFLEIVRSYFCDCKKEDSNTNLCIYIKVKEHKDLLISYFKKDQITVTILYSFIKNSSYTSQIQSTCN